MTGHPDKESCWIRVMGLKIYTKKSFGRERLNSLALSVVPPFACFLPPGVRAAICFSVAVFFCVTQDMSERATTHSLTSSKSCNKVNYIFTTLTTHYACGKLAFARGRRNEQKWVLIAGTLPFSLSPSFHPRFASRVLLQPTT